TRDTSSINSPISRSSKVYQYNQRSPLFFSFFFSSRRRHTRSKRDWSSDVCSSDLRDFVKDRLRVLVTSPEPFQIQHTHPTKLSVLDGGGRRHYRVHRCTHHGHGKLERVDLPVQRHIFWVAGSTGGHNRYGIQRHGFSTTF